MTGKSAEKIIQEVKDNCKQISSSKKDEIIVMRAMLNDSNFSVGIYDETGKIGDYTPGKDVRNMLSGIVSSTTKISNDEAKALVDNYEFTNSDAKTMVNFNKEYLNTYLRTGRKLPLGGREDSNVELSWKEFDEKTMINPNFNNGESSTKEITIPKHSGIKATNKCPVWVKADKK